MPHISIISASVRTGRLSHRIALYFKNYLSANNFATSEILDLEKYNFPLFDERLTYQKEPDSQTLEFAEKIKYSDGVLIVTPEYNGGYPSSLKNVIDMLDVILHHKPVAVATGSDGVFGGSQVITSLQFTLWKMYAIVSSARFPVQKMQDAFDADGNPADKEKTDKRANVFIKEFLWIIDACNKMKRV